MNLNGRKIAILGGAGFFGSHIVDILKIHSNAIDIPRKNEYDFRNMQNCLEYFKKVKPQIVINCAAFQGGIGFHSGNKGISRRFSKIIINALISVLK